MGFVPFANVVRLESVYIWDGQVVENVFHYWSVAEWTETMMGDLAAGWKNEWNTGIKPIQSNTLSLSHIVVTSLEEQNSPSLLYNTGLPLAGTLSSPSMPNNVSVAVKWYTNYRGRSYRGRTYHLGLTEGDITGNTVAPAVVTNLMNGYQLFTVISNGTAEAVLGVASRIHNGAERAQGLFTPITALSVEQYVDSQRRRLPGRGR